MSSIHRSKILYHLCPLKLELNLNFYTLTECEDFSHKFAWPGAGHCLYADPVGVTWL